MLKFKVCTKQNFISSISTNKGDKFANTFVAKANMQNQWRFCIGLYDNENLMGAIITTYSKREPKIANLQLLHTFFKYRGMGVGKKLCQFSLNYAIKNNAEYILIMNIYLLLKKVGSLEKVITQMLAL